MKSIEQITIRSANSGDREAANRIHKSAYPNDPYTYANNIRIPGTLNLVAVKSTQVIGFISVLINHSNPQGKFLWERMRPYIGFLGVAEEHRNSGVGIKLVTEASHRSLLLTGAKCIYLECGHTNEKAQKLYEKIGFKIVSLEEVENSFGRPPHLKSLVYKGCRNLFGKE